MSTNRGLFSLLLIATTLLGGCRRTCSDVWEDTKTCGRHMGRGVYALFGGHPAEGHPCTAEDFAYDTQEDFIPFSDEDLYRGIMRGDELALLKIDADSAIPQSRLQPGELGSPIPGIDAFRDPTSTEQSVFRNVHFETDDYTVRGNDNLETIRRIADYLKQRPHVFLFIEGHCDERGPSAYNLALGTRRSNAVRNALIKEGVNPDHLLTISYGKERPLARSHDAAAWKLNRRGQFKLHQHQGDPVCVR